MEKKNIKYVYVIGVIILIASSISFLVYSIVTDYNDDIVEVVEGKIIEVNYLGHPPIGSDYFPDCDVLELIFDNNSSYIIVTRSDLDLTVNSKFIFRFYKDDTNDLYWQVDRMHKIP